MSDSDAREEWKAEKWVTLFTTVIAVAATVASLKGGSAYYDAQMTTVSAAAKWSYYQSKSIKETARETEAVILRTMETSAPNPEARETARRNAAAAESEAARYTREKAEIANDAKRLDAEVEYWMRRGAKFDAAILLLQISTILCAVALLVRKNQPWYVGLLTGVIGGAMLIFAWALYPAFSA